MKHVLDDRRRFWLRFIWLATCRVDMNLVAKEWEASSEIRSQLRRYQQVLIKEPWDEKVKISVKSAEKNFAVLKPLVRRLRGKDGKVGMHTVPTLEKQYLGGSTEMGPRSSCALSV